MQYMKFQNALDDMLLISLYCKQYRCSRGRPPLDLTHLSFVRIGQEMLMDEDYADDEIESELAPIVVQIAYVQQVNNCPLLICLKALNSGL